MNYTHHNNALNLNHIQEKVFLKGWVQKVRHLGGLIFIDLRDRFGITQLVIKPENPNYELAKTIKNEFVIEAKGIVIERESKNKNLDTGEIEVEVTKLSVLSTSEQPPMIVANETDALEETRLKYRYLDLRRPVMQNFLIKRHQITQSIRSVLVDQDFYELETPILGKSTPEGARDYLVPSRLYAGHFYALPQSPQIFKQLFMIAGFEKYFQIARCFRDEDLRADRQPEFTQVDIEASFIDEEDVYRLAEQIMKTTFKKVLDEDILTPFKRLTYQEAMETYGNDKPDTRFDLKLQDYTNVFKPLDIPLFADASYIKGILIPDGSQFTRKKIDELTVLAKKHHAKALAYLKYSDGTYSGSIAKFLNDDAGKPLDGIKHFSLDENNLLLLVPGNYEDVSSALSALRLSVGEQLGLIDENLNHFLWVTDFPLLEYAPEEKRYYARHHPFTAPKDFESLRDNPEGALSKSYDLVLNGYELGGGSIRIHTQDVQQLMFDTLGLSKEQISNRFGFFIDALKYGTPPHGGIALGLDRIVMLMTKTKNIKDVIAFPKTQSAKDMMMQAPSDVDAQQLAELSLRISKK